MAAIAPRVANVGIRGLALGSKFVVLIVLARLLEPAEIGLYGLFAATLGFSMMLIGGDYYYYSNRELLAEPKERWSFVLQHQLLAAMLLYAVLLPAQALIFWFDLLPWHMAAWFFVLLVTEHLSIEIFRLLAAMQRQLVASLTLLLRAGVWGWVLLPVMWVDATARTLELVFAAWLVGGLLSIALGVAVIWREASPWHAWPVDTAWLKRGFRFGLMFLIATVCSRALQTVDRYAVEALGGVDFLGVYVLYFSVATIILIVLDPAVFSFLYPRLLAAYRQGDEKTYRKVMRELAYSAVAGSFIIAFSIAMLAPYVFVWIGKPIYLEHLEVFWLLIAMGILQTAGTVPHYGLYAIGAKKSIVAAHISSLLVFVAVLATLFAANPQKATAYALIAAFLWMGLFKLWCYCRFRNEMPWSGSARSG